MSEISAEPGVHPTQLNRWRTEALEKLPVLFEKTTSYEKAKAEHEKENRAEPAQVILAGSKEASGYVASRSSFPARLFSTRRNVQCS